jgi:hypothetical protein
MADLKRGTCCIGVATTGFIEGAAAQAVAGHRPGPGVHYPVRTTDDD